MRSTRMIAILALWTVLLNGCASDCGQPTPLRDEEPRNLITIADDLSPLRSAFNSESDRWRVVALVSPTCSECIHGAEAVQKEIIARYGRDRVDALIVWVPMLSSDDEESAHTAATIFSADRATQFYDGRKTVGLAYASGTFSGFLDRARKALPDGHSLVQALDDRREAARAQWDLYMLYSPGVRWETSTPDADQEPPMPNHWIRHCGRNDGTNSTYWRDSPDTPPRQGNLFDVMRDMADGTIGATLTPE